MSEGEASCCFVITVNRSRQITDSVLNWETGRVILLGRHRRRAPKSLVRPTCGEPKARHDGGRVSDFDGIRKGRVYNGTRRPTGTTGGRTGKTPPWDSAEKTTCCAAKKT